MHLCSSGIEVKLDQAQIKWVVSLMIADALSRQYSSGVCLYKYVGCAWRRVVRSERSQWHERFCCDPEFMGLNPRWVEIGGLLFLF